MVSQEIDHGRTLHLADDIQETFHAGAINLPTTACVSIQRQKRKGKGIADLY